QRAGLQLRHGTQVAELEHPKTVSPDTQGPVLRVRSTPPMANERWTLDPDRCFSPEPSVRSRARELHAEVERLPLVSPHGHVAARLFADEGARLPDPATLFVTGDPYVFRLLHAHGLAHEELGLAPLGGGDRKSTRLNSSHVKISYAVFCL